MQFRPLTLAAAAALCLAGNAYAAVVTFNNPGVILIEPISNVATYTESGFKIQGQAADFLLLNNGPGTGFLVGGFQGAGPGLPGAGPITLMAASGGIFSLLSLDLDYFDVGNLAGLLTISGILDGAQVATSIFALNAPASITFGANWAQLTQVSFLATSGFSLDNIRVAAVPEPGTLALVGLAAAGLAFTRRGTGVATTARA